MTNATETRAWYRICRQCNGTGTANGTRKATREYFIRVYCCEDCGNTWDLLIQPATPIRILSKLETKEDNPPDAPA